MTDKQRKDTFLSNALYSTTNALLENFKDGLLNETDFIKECRKTFDMYEKYMKYEKTKTIPNNEPCKCGFCNSFEEFKNSDGECDNMAYIGNKILFGRIDDLKFCPYCGRMLE